MQLVTIARDASLNPVLIQVPISELIAREGRLDNGHEASRWIEYRYPGFDRLVHRSASVNLKEMPQWADAAIGRVGGGGITPSDCQPDSPTQRQIRRLAHLRLGGVRFANTQALCSQAKVDLMNGLHAFGSSVVRGATTKDSYKAALYLASASRGAGDTVYNNTGELAASGNYTQGGIAVTTGTAPSLSGTTAIFTPSASLVWSNLTSSGAFDAMLLYNDTSSTKLAVAVFTFGSQSVVAGTFTLTMPTNDASNALLRIA
jgi:hypothetical protein